MHTSCNPLVDFWTTEVVEYISFKFNSTGRSVTQAKSSRSSSFLRLEVAE